MGCVNVAVSHNFKLATTQHFQVSLDTTNIEKIYKVNVIKINIINKQNRTKLTRNKKVKVSGFKKAIITLKKGQSIDLTTGI